MPGKRALKLCHKPQTREATDSQLSKAEQSHGYGLVFPTVLLSGRCDVPSKTDAKPNPTQSNPSGRGDSVAHYSSTRDTIHGSSVVTITCRADRKEACSASFFSRT